MKHKLLCSLLFFLLQSFFLLEGHGFDGKTSIKRGSISWPIKQLYDNPQKDNTLRVSSYDFETKSIHTHKIKAAGISKTNCYIRIRFDNNPTHDITCTPSQKFYVASVDDWYHAYQLCTGDQLLCAEGTVKVAEVQCIKEPLTVYALEVKKAHTFFVGHYAILTHNMLVPWTVTAGLGIAFGTGATTGGTAGSFLGPVTCIGCAVLGGIIGCGIKIMTDDRRAHYQLCFDTDTVHDQCKYGVLYNDKNNDAQAPGKPTEKDGFFPKKNWDGKKVRNPNGAGYGWPDKNGWVWIPTGPKGHGGPHWDVEGPNGEYKNVVPGGRIRGQR
jgi:hypothetical protein